MVITLTRVYGQPSVVHVNPASIAWMCDDSAAEDDPITTVRMHTGELWAVEGKLDDMLRVWREALEAAWS